MNKYTFLQIALLGLRKLYSSVFEPKANLIDCELNADKASELIYNALICDSPCMITRFGAVEISALTNYLGVRRKIKKSLWKFIKGETPEWWWNEGIRYSMTNNAGFFPATDENLIKFGELMLDSIKSIDILGSWQPAEKNLVHYFPKASLINFVFLDPYWSDKPWTRALEGKTVLVVHPFAELIVQQYKNNKQNLFQKKDILPLFDLKVVKAVQSTGGSSQYTDWFEALEHMKKEIDKQYYDICLIGAGAYGLPLAAYVKQSGKKAVHVGGTLQLLFGIWGKRWDNPKYAAVQLQREGAYLTLFNDFWAHPGNEFRPSNFKQIEGGCYW